MPASTSPQICHEEAFRKSEASVRLEGVDPVLDPRYMALKARILAGEITSSEAIQLLLAPYKNARSSAA